MTNKEYQKFKAMTCKQKQIIESRGHSSGWSQDNPLPRNNLFQQNIVLLKKVLLEICCLRLSFVQKTANKVLFKRHADCF